MRRELKDLTRFLTFEIPESVEIDAKNDKEGTFILTPLEPGFGTTIGNALRRVLLSSLEGFAITHVKISGVPHEFYSIDGIKEDVIDIIQNLKEVRFKAIKENPKGEIFVSLRNKEVFTGANINDATNEFEVVNPDIEIAHMNKDAELDMYIHVMKGRGFVFAEEHEREDKPDSDNSRLIPIDSKFSPIRKVSYKVENTRVGKKTDYEKLILNVTTDGTITPQQAVEEAANILIQHLYLLNSDNLKPLKTTPKEDKKDKQKVDPDFWKKRRMLQTPLNEIDIPVRAYNCLRSANIKTIGDLVTFTSNDLLKFRNFGKKSLGELEKLLHERGLALGMDVSKYHLDKSDEEVKKMFS